ncbi:2-amino-4-hydroxy-6-hydroxymethyldihydropteridine diphosphokinase [Dongshaea marina]|uniref:2-amino-4-hydroxy-6- hydroxymethyldihydropteridine diphosphokinase n=1 Tax=Dongshaea marina TaxID=2047966 RepID=UPI000D3E5AA9|nr:2-amino-4-hydroxy-6-hydroxymethyldihydropteridine diphosphokinase [Dongshaea marina]
MATIYIGVGSNIEREQHIRMGIKRLAQLFGELSVSQVYESEAFGFIGERFYNLVIGANTQWPVSEVASRLRAIEIAHGRPEKSSKFCSRTLDLDLLLYDDLISDGEIKLPREDILSRVFVLRPLAELAPQLIHPELQQPMAELWRNFAGPKQLLWPVDLELGSVISAGETESA